MENINILEKDKCCGCMGCMNVCPVNAIEMKENDEGFLMPEVNEKCINCGKCTKACPVLNPHYENNKEPDLYAFRADDKTRAKSSSGGLFSLIADEIFKRGGYVCGAAFDENIILSHIITDNKNDMPKLRGSKYLQSNIGMVYKEIAALLKKGKTVFFCGTPCQAAALRGSLNNKNYENLYIMDILCHGVASQNIFSKYIDERFGGSENIEKINFRDKNLGWNCSKIHINLKNGIDYVGTKESDPYEIGFQNSIFLRKSCNDCKFAQFPRQGDITGGDFWGILKFDSSQNDRKGTSVVFVNNEKGKELFDIISKNSEVKFKKYDFVTSKISIRNRIRPKTTFSPNRDKFFELIKTNHSLSDSIDIVSGNEVSNKNTDKTANKTITEKFSEINDISKYLKKLGNPDKKYLVIICVKWSIGRYLDEKHGSLLKISGFKEDVVKKLKMNYIGVVYGGKTLFEEKSNEHDVTYKSIVQGSEISVLSHREENDSETSIKINKTEYSINGRGINIVVYDPESRIVVDSVSFDTLTPEIKSYRKIKTK